MIFRRVLFLTFSRENDIYDPTLKVDLHREGYSQMQFNSQTVSVA
jgi:hypothetical protein